MCAANLGISVFAGDCLNVLPDVVKCREQNRTEQNRTEQNRTEQNKTLQYSTFNVAWLVRFECGELLYCWVP